MIDRAGRSVLGGKYEDIAEIVDMDDGMEIEAKPDMADVPDRARGFEYGGHLLAAAMAPDQRGRTIIGFSPSRSRRQIIASAATRT